MVKKVNFNNYYEIRRAIETEAPRIEDTRVYHITNKFIESFGIDKRKLRNLIINSGYFTRTIKGEMYVSKNKWDINLFVKEMKSKHPKIV